MANLGQETDGLKADTTMTETGNSPSGASATTTVVGFSIDQGALYADFNAKSTIVGGQTPYV